MRTSAVLGSILASTAVIVVGWQAGGAVLARQSSTMNTLASTAQSTTPTTTAPTSPTTAPVAKGPVDGNYTGGIVNTPYGSVQVAVTLSGGTITDVTALHLTNAGGRSVQISNYAAPILRSEVLTSQSARVANVSGATYTSEGYLRSFQSALDQAGF